MSSNRGWPAASSRGRRGRRGCSGRARAPGRSPRGCAGGTSRPRGRGRERVGEGLGDRDRCLRVMGPVEAVLEPQAVPVHGGLEVAAVLDVDGHRPAFWELELRPGNGTVVGEHPHGCVTDPLRDRNDLESKGSPSSSSTSSGRTPPVAPPSRSATAREQLAESRGGTSLRPSLCSAGAQFRPAVPPLDDLVGDELGVVLDPSNERGPRVCCHFSPRKYRPGTSVTPRRWRTRPRSSETGTRIQEWSGR